MDVDVVTSIEIDRPPGEVAVFAADPGNAPEWYVNIESVDWHGEPGLRLGARADFIAHFLGRRIAYTYEVTAYDPGARLVMRTADVPFPMETRYTWEELPDARTRMTLRNVGRPTGFAGVAAPLIAAAIRRANRKDLRLLKEILER